MGIPSYYKKLTQSVPNLVHKGQPDSPISWLFMDFNCLIYHCLQREDTPKYMGDLVKEDWEDLFLECVKNYCLKIIQEVNPSEGIYIAIDGVVPMAKMRQQRLRRFKSSWLKKQEAKEGDDATWDKNSITPGTYFMAKLRNKLLTISFKKKDGKHSIQCYENSSDQPGEGEHKIMEAWRTDKYKGNFAVYGLDADLILLSMLTRETQSLSNKIWLFREEVNAGKIVYNSMGEEEFEWFSIHALHDSLCSDFSEKHTQQLFIRNYCFAMSVLGNDFLPTSLGLKIRDDGHSEIIEIVKTLISQETPMVNTDNSISFQAVLKLFTLLSEQEEQRISKYIGKKMSMSHHLASNQEQPEIGHNDWPMYHMEEHLLMETKYKLKHNWQSLYLTHFFPGFDYTASSINKICKEYLYGIQWIWAYYTGNTDQVCFNWYYPHSLPPLWIWISDYLKMKTIPEFPEKVLLHANDIQPIEQLALVLPLASWSLLPSGPLKQLPFLAPHLFPESFGFETIGKRFFWECESIIPVPSMYTLKELIKKHHSL